LLRCHAPCRYQAHVQEPPKEPPLCPKCGRQTYLSDVWYFILDHQGKSYLHAGLASRGHTEILFGKRRAELREGRYFNKLPKTSWTKIQPRFEAYTERKEPGTHRMYVTCIRRLAADGFARYTLDAIPVTELQSWIGDRLKEGMANGTINRHMATLKRMLNLAIEWSSPTENLLERSQVEARLSLG